LDVLILGCGYTGRRVARRFLAHGANVTETHRNTARFEVKPGALVLHSVPPEGSAGLLEMLGDTPARVVYLSTTGVYGDAQFVDESTPVSPRTEKYRLRVEEEQRVAAGPWSSLILRPAAIYGPGRGAHESLKKGKCRVDDNFVSRIHVDDLAAHVEAGLLSDVTGAYPVADEEPCTSREIAEFCAKLLDLPLPLEQTKTLSTSRRVDGSAIRRALGITLRYPSYRVGVPASSGSSAATSSSSPAVK
jgi:nucleoside-diphosphate-sugar epimerase